MTSISLRFEDAIEDLLALPITRYSVGPLMRRAFSLRDDVTPYDAAYVALTEGLAATLITGDGRLSRATGTSCDIELLS